MKPTQTVLLLLGVVALIFGVTFASMYVGKANRSTPQVKKQAAGKDLRDLQFEFPRYPYGEDANDMRWQIVTEYGKRGSHDFWFVNPNDEELRVGLARKSCECSDVRVLVASEGWGSFLVAPRYTEIGLAGQHLLSTALAITGRLSAAARQQMLDGATDLGELGSEGVSVPPRRLGVVRLSWEAKRKGAGGTQAEALLLEVWSQDARRTPAKLAVGMFLVDGIRLDVADLNVGVLRSNDTVRRVIRFWSNSRDDFDLEVTSTGAPFIVCGPREPLTEQDREELLKRLGGPIRSGYRYPVLVRERADNGSHFDTGRFTHRLTFKPREYVNLSAPLEVPVNGFVRGDVVLAGADQAIVLPPFLVRDGASAKATLYTERRGLSLKVDRKPDFLTATLSEPKEEGRRTTWTLSVEIGPNKVSGSFPRNDPWLRDTAIYLKVEGADRRLRIPVSGTARQ